jgi:hypothetical protein
MNNPADGAKTAGRQLGNDCLDDTAIWWITGMPPR